MRGTVLLLAGQDIGAQYAEHLRANGLLVYEVANREDALRQTDVVAPDVIVAICSGHGCPSVIPEVRSRVDRATSIIVAVAGEERQPALIAGADSVLPLPLLPEDVLYEVQRALILRRSGRRLSPSGNP
jgi:DNA-binding response OmpR family regulator